MTDIAIKATGLSKRYKIGLRKDPYGRLTEALWSSVTRSFRHKSEPRPSDEFWAHRAQWSGQVDAAQDPFPDHGTDHRQSRTPWARRLAARGGNRFPP
jgi:hypothetical protein